MSTGNEAPFLRFAQPLDADEIQSALIIAPHPDDESLGCGGTIAILRNANIPVSVLFVSDGSMSHPSSKKYPADSLIALREREAVNALEILGVSKSSVRFMRLKDAAVPTQNDLGFEESVSSMRKEINTLQPAVIFVPWRRDPHKDHRATAAIAKQALVNYALPIRVLEYFIWLWERSKPEDFPQEEEVFIRRVDIAFVMKVKRDAVMAHLSQVTNLIDDDPGGFTLSPEVLSHFWGSVEYFAETKT